MVGFASLVFRNIGGVLVDPEPKLAKFGWLKGGWVHPYRVLPGRRTGGYELEPELVYIEGVPK